MPSGTGQTSLRLPDACDPAVVDRLRKLTAQLVEDTQRVTGVGPLATFDPEWPSSCIVRQLTDGRCEWRPVPMDASVDLTRLGHALDVTLHPGWRALFATQWSDALPLRYNGEPFILLQLWNDQDLDNLIANQIGHALEKRRIRQSLTLFFGLIDDDRLLSVDNDSGAVVLETLGRPGPDQVSASVLEFLNACEVHVATATVT